jgi:hypothetical protein
MPTLGPTDEIDLFFAPKRLKAETEHGQSSQKPLIRVAAVLSLILHQEKG